MAFNGSGTYQLPAGQPVVTGTTISSSTHNTLANDLATALSLCMTKDGQQTPTANIKFGGYRLTGIGAATDVADAVRASQAQNSALSYLASVAGTNTITASATPTPAAYAAGQRFVFIPANTSTSAATLNVSSLGAKDIFYKGAALIGGELRANVPVSVIYDGTQFNIEDAYSRKVQSRSSDTILGVGDRESTLIATGSYTQTLTAASTLGDGWFIDVIVDSGVTLVIDPNSTEQIDGANTKTIVGPAQGRLVCNGTLFRTEGLVSVASQAEMQAGTEAALRLMSPLRVAEAIAALSNSMTLGTEQNSGSNVAQFTGIPAGTKEITMLFYGWGSNGTSPWIVQIGDSGGFEDASYASVCGAPATVTTATDGFLVHESPNASYAYAGIVTLKRVSSDGTKWVCTSHLVDGSGGGTSPRIQSGVKALSAELDRVRWTTQGGANNSDAGSINIQYQ